MVSGDEKCRLWVDENINKKRGGGYRLLKVKKSHREKKN